MSSPPTPRLSALALTRERRDATNDDVNFHILDGYDRLVEQMAEGLDIRLGHAVERVAWGEAGVTLTLAGGEVLEAHRVIITVPVGVLQAGKPGFDPPLPEAKQTAIDTIAVGHVIKLMLWFDHQLWPDFVVLRTDGRIVTWWVVESAATPTVMGYVGGPAALELSALGEQEVINLGLAELSQLFGADAADACLGGRMSSWSEDPWSLGGYTYSPVGMGDAREALAAPLGPLHFAGEATLTNGHIATVHGAIESGWRAADEVIAAPVRQSIH